MKNNFCLAFALLGSLGFSLAQTSANYKLVESTINAGGDPQNGSYAASASYRIKLDAIGGAVIAAGLSSAGFHMDGGFVDTYAPPKEVLNLRWTDSTNLLWDLEESVGAYEVYRDLLGTLPGGFGSCFQPGLVSETLSDATAPSLGAGWFYLVTARNRIAEEGTKGYQSNSTERGNPSPCP
jgi:hypothetical protein